MAISKNSAATSQATAAALLSHITLKMGNTHTEVDSHSTDMLVHHHRVARLEKMGVLNIRTYGWHTRLTSVRLTAVVENYTGNKLSICIRKGTIHVIDMSTLKVLNEVPDYDWLQITKDGTILDTLK